MSERTALDIDRQVARILSDLDDPEPPLRLDDVRRLLTLDLAWYTSSDDGLLRETWHRIKMAGKQILDRPSLLVDAVKKFSLKALWVPDRKTILLDRELPTPKQRWGEAHEIGHSILDLHEPMAHGDQQQTLSHACHQQLEAEANYAAGRLLFFCDRFADELHGREFKIDSIKALAKRYGNTMTSAIWRAVESKDTPVFGIISEHPRDFGKLTEGPIRYFVRSRRFAREFSRISPSTLFELLGSFCRRGPGPIGESEFRLIDDNGAQHTFLMECFFNRYDALTLGGHICRRNLTVNGFSIAS